MRSRQPSPEARAAAAAAAIPSPEVVGALARIEAMLAERTAALESRLATADRRVADLAAEVIDLRRQVADGRAHEWLSIRACCLRYDVARDEVLRRIAAGELVTRPARTRGYDTHQVHIDSARAAFGVPVPA